MINAISALPAPIFLPKYRVSSQGNVISRLFATSMVIAPEGVLFHTHHVRARFHGKRPEFGIAQSAVELKQWDQTNK
jgi:hypothetical protein